MTQNVVTYTVEVATDNPDGKLLPYLTANVQFQTGYHEDVVVVPNAALRWSPRPEAVAVADTSGSPDAPGRGGRGDGRGGGRRNGGGGGGNGANGGPTTRRAGSGEDTSRGTLYVQEGDLVRPVPVRLGLVDTDKGVTEILSPNLTEGTNVISGEQRAEAAAAGPVSPFMPQFSGRGGGGGGGGRRGGF
jgi:HlyD family secretion protein